MKHWVAMQTLQTKERTPVDYDDNTCVETKQTDRPQVSLHYADNFNSPVTTKELQFMIFKSSKNKHPSQESFIGKIGQAFEDLTPILYNVQRITEHFSFYFTYQRHTDNR